MRVEVSQLVPGCILAEDILGKSNNPIMPNKTVLTEKHITVLQKFMIENVNVSSTLADGAVYTPPASPPKKEGKTIEKEFIERYNLAVNSYRSQFVKWKHSFTIDIPAIRNIIMPVLKNMDESAVYTLHHYTQKDDYVYHHSVAVAILAAFIAKKMGYAKGDYLQVGLAGLLSDAGMAKLDDRLSKKGSDLTVTEQKELKKHPVYAYRLIENAPSVTKAVKLAVLQHHERNDGSGYPLGMKQEKIHKYAKIIAVADNYHAMTSSQNSPLAVIKELQKEQVSKFDYQVVKAFTAGYVNSFVK